MRLRPPRKQGLLPPSPLCPRNAGAEGKVSLDWQGRPPRAAGLPSAPRTAARPQAFGTDASGGAGEQAAPWGWAKAGRSWCECIHARARMPPGDVVSRGVYCVLMRQELASKEDQERNAPACWSAGPMASCFPCPTAGRRNAGAGNELILSEVL